MMIITKSSIRATFSMLTLLTVLFGFIYPFISTLLVKTIFPYQTQGSLIIAENGEILGSKYIGQNFSDAQYFWGRMSAVNYDATTSGGSNLSVGNPHLLDNVKARIEALKAVDADNTKPIPVDLVTASASGLDPEISLAAAEYQIARVAKARNLNEDDVRKMVQKFTYGRQFGILGEPRVSILQLNLALDGKI